MSKARGEPRPEAAVLPITVALVEPTGSRTYVNFDLAGTSVLAELEPGDVRGPGEDLTLHVDMSRAVLIDPATDRVLA